MTNTNFPLVILIDLDGTIIGDISQQVITFEIAKATTKSIFDAQDFKFKLQNGLIRPYFGTFVRSLTVHRPNIELFVYTASEKTWAEHVIKHIEQVIGVKVNRPIFSRTSCVYNEQQQEYKKSVGFVITPILKCLKRKYGITFAKKDFINRVLVIDNNNVYSHSDQKRIVVCPTYNHRVPENVVAKIPIEIFKKHTPVIIAILKKYIPLSSTAHTDYNQFQREFYMYYLHYLSNIEKMNAKYAHDKLWLHLRDILMTHNITLFDEKNIKYINKVLIAADQRRRLV